MNLLYQIIQKNKKQFFFGLTVLAVIAGFFYFYKNRPIQKGDFLTDNEIQALKSDSQNLILIGTDLNTDKDSNYKNIYLINGACLIIKMSPDKKNWPTITVAESIFIDKNSKIMTNYQNPSGSGLIRMNSSSNDYGGDGGTLGGVGGSGDCLKSSSDNLPPLQKDDVYSGAAGASALKVDNSRGGRGGGIIILKADKITIHGEISAKGENGINSGGGGSGGYIFVQTNHITIDGLIDVSGGNGGDGQIYGGGGGSGGIIRLITKENLTQTIEKFLNLSGGRDGIAYDIYTGCRGSNGASGTLLTE